MQNIIKDNKYFRIRIFFIKEYLKKSDDKNLRKLLQNGYIPKDLEKEFDIFVKEIDKSKFDDKQLTFLELTSYATYFAKHKEKITGEIKPTTSIFFPLQTIATKEQVITTIDKTLKGNKNLKLLKLKAKALKLKLELLKI